MMKISGWGLTGFLAIAGLVAAGCQSDIEVDEAEQAALTPCTVSIVSAEAAVTWGQTVHLTATPSCPSGTPEMRWFKRVGTGSWTLVQNYNSSLTFNHVAQDVGTTQYLSQVRQQGTGDAPANSNTPTVAVSDTVASCTSVAMVAPTNNSSGMVGIPLTLTASASCPAGTSPEYQFWVKPSTSGTWTILPGYVTGSSSWAPSGTGGWHVSAVARSVGSHVNYQVRSSAVLVNVSNAPANNPPVANTDSISTTKNVAASVNVLGNDFDADSHPLTVISNTNGASGTVTIGGSFGGGGFALATYTPNLGFTGSDSFTYTISDGNGGTATGTVNVTVSNQAPSPGSDSISTTVNVAGSTDVLSNDSDPDGDTLSVSSFTQGTNGSVAFGAFVATTGVLVYTPNTGFAGEDSFEYTVTDGADSVTTTVAVTVTNQGPVAHLDQITTTVNQNGSVDVLANDYDQDGETVTVTSFTSATSGSVSFLGGVATYTPNLDFVGTDAFTYTISDPHGATATATVEVIVNNNNQGPVAENDELTVDANQTGTVDVLANDSDPNSDPISVISNTDPSNGTASFEGGVASYTPSTNFYGVDTFTYTISDGVETASASVSITVNNLAPVAGTDSLTVNGTVPGSVNVLTNDSDGNGGALSVTSFSQGTKGAVTFAGGTATYTAGPGTSGADSFTYTLSDGQGGSATGTVNVTIQSAQPGCTISVSLQESSSTWGNVIHLSATAICNTGPAQIQWYKKFGGVTVIQPWTSATTLDYTVVNVGTVQFYAQARTQGTTSAQATSNTINVAVSDNVPSCTATSVTAPTNNGVLTQGVAATLSATASCPAGVTPEFQFWVKPSATANWTILPGYFTGSSSWTPPSVGSWNISVVARAVGAHVNYQVRSSAIGVTVQAAP
jgi:hypothetical protein